MKPNKAVKKRVQPYKMIHKGKGYRNWAVVKKRDLLPSLFST